MPYFVVPTPVPAPNTPALKDAGTPTNLSWNYPPGKVPVCHFVVGCALDHTLILHSRTHCSAFSPSCAIIILWVGIPTPDPALLVEMAPPDNGTPTSLKWKFPTRAPAPKEPAKWNYPPGQPTPNPALLTDVVDKVDWGYPPGVPTPGKHCVYGVGKFFALVVY